MFKTLRIILALTVISMGAFTLLTDNHWLQPYMFFILCLMLLVMGLEELQKGRKAYGYLSFFVSMFLVIVLFIIK
ncbi:DUF3953 domain-containing protein [Rossellomorea aquimaris]|uniref:DUF3953 domain-containing protein n=1 Tax=Rossellomorea aquimaris TaxID=189382 RepID=UPI0007D0AF83|nr:DUF3953 domain-containing protein [Rossellomorea aquimaris]